MVVYVPSTSETVLCAVDPLAMVHSHGSASYYNVINSVFYTLFYGSLLIDRQEIMRTEKLREGRSKVPLALLGSSGRWVTIEQGNLCCGSWVLYNDILSF